MADHRFTGAPPCAASELPLVFDELPLWSAPFGLALLDAVDLATPRVALDVGCGTGFPLLELAQRLGPRARVHGVDPWDAALARARTKATVLRIPNVVLHRARAEALPFPDASVDLLVSNNGLSNVADPERAFAECGRVARGGAQLVFTYNLPDTMREVYDVYEGILRERGMTDALARVAAHIDRKRKPLAVTTAWVERAGFRVDRIGRHAFTLRFADATAMLAHAFMRLAFLPPWVEILPPEEREGVFTGIERRLNERAARAGALALTVPFACYDCRRVAGRPELHP